MNGFSLLATVLALAATTAAASASNWLDQWRKDNPVWRGVHWMASSDAALTDLEKQIKPLADQGVNVIVLEVDYSYQFKNRPEMANPQGISLVGARAFASSCRKAGVRLIPQVNCLGHQSWAEHTDALLTKHPELDETPGLYPDNKDIYCRSWCPQHPDLASIVFPLLDEIADAFQADAFHVGMDEVFLIGSDACPRCKGKNPADLFAKQVNDLHRHLVGKRKLEMLMWSDRFLDGKATGYGEWEASENGTHPAIDMVPKDIVMCDWHYEKRSDYPSVKVFTDKGFRVWPSSWKDESAAELFSLAGKSAPGGKVIGHLVTTWGAVGVDGLADWPALVKPLRLWR